LRPLAPWGATLAVATGRQKSAKNRRFERRRRAVSPESACRSTAKMVKMAVFRPLCHPSAAITAPKPPELLAFAARACARPRKV
jgi:hypothetical protein